MSGTASLDGLLDLTLSDGFALDAGQQFTVLTAGELVDTGLDLVGTAAAHFEMFVTAGAGGGVVLEFLGGDFTVPGDYNDNGIVEQADLDLVLVNWGADSEDRLLGWINDRPTEGFVSQVHLDAVLANWGKAIPAIAVSGVPEPTGLALAAVAVLCGVFLASRRR